MATLSKGANTARTTFKDFKSSIKNTHDELEKFGRATGTTIRRFSAFIGVVTLFNSVKDSIRESTKEAVSFEKEMYKISQVTGIAIKDLGDIDKEITRLSKTLGVSSAKLVDISLTLAQAGISAKDTKIALETLAKTDLSATFTDMRSTTEGVIAAMSIFNVKGKDLERVISSINTVSAKYAVESDDLITGLRKAGGAFQATGGSIEELNALMTSVRASTRQSADAIATGFNTIFARLQRPKTLDFLEDLGISLRDMNGEFIGSYKAVEKLSIALKDVSGKDPRFAQIIEEIGGYRQIPRTIALIKEFDVAQKALSTSQRAGASISEDAAIAQLSLSNQLARVREEFNALIRSVLNDTIIRGFIKLTLDLASAFIKVADSVRPIVPLLTILGGKFLFNSTAPYLKGVSDVLRSKPRGFNRGGVVPGEGIGDKIPALLEPKEFVINKKSAQAFGYDNLKRINKYAKGGAVGNVALGAALVGPQVAESLGKGVGIDSSAFQPFISALTLAAGSLILFQQVLKKDTDSLGEHISQVKDDIKQTEALSNSVKEETDASLAAGKRSIKVRSADKFRNRIAELERKRDEAGKFIFNKNPAIASKASNTFINAEAEIKKERADFAANRHKRLNEIRNEQRSLATANRARRDTELDKFSEKRKKLEEELKKSERQKLRDDRNNKFATGIGIASAVGFAGGGLLSQLAESRLAGGQTRGTAAIAGAGGALSGAATGATVGFSLGGPYGAAIGAVIGGLSGFTSALWNTTSQIDKMEFDKRFTKFADSLSSVTSGRSTVATQKGGIETFLKEIDKAFLTTKGEEFRNLKGTVSQSVDGLEEYLRKIIELGGSTEDVIKENESLVLALARFGNQSIPDIEKKIANQVDARKIVLKQQSLTADNTTRLNAVLNIGGAIGDAQRSVNNMNIILDGLDQFANGIGTLRTTFDFSALDDIGNSNIRDVTSQATLAGSLIGGPASGLAKDVISAAKVSQELPAILDRLVNSNQFEGRDIGVELQDAIGKGFAQSLILEKFGSLISGGNSTQFLEKFRQDPAGVTKELQSSIDPLIIALRDATPRIIEQFDSFSDGLAKSRENFFHSLDGLAKVIDIQDIAADIIPSLTGNRRTLADKQGFEQRRFNLLGGGSSVEQLGTRLVTAQTNIANLRQAQGLTTTEREFKDLENVISEQITEEGKVRQALEFSADVTSRLANVQQEIGRFEKTRSSKNNLAKDFVFGNAEAKRDIIKGIIGAGQIQANLAGGKSPLQGLSPELVEKARQLFETFEDSPIFGGKTGKERLNETIAASIPGFNPDALNPEETALVGAAQKIAKDAELAQKILNNNLTSINEKFIDGLGQKFDSFFENLRKSFVEREQKLLEDSEKQKFNKILNIDKQIGSIDKIANLTGLPVKTDADFGVIKNNLQDALEITKKESKNKEALSILDDLQRNPFKVDIKKIEALLGSTKESTEFVKAASGAKPIVKFNLANTALKKFVEEQDVQLSESYKSLAGNLGKLTTKFVDNAKEVERLLKGVEGGKESLEQIKIENRANGGMIWKKRGTDTVPAMTTDGQPYMLTPGEMVMNRRAVGKYGPELVKMNYAADGALVKENSREKKLAGWPYSVNGKDYPNWRAAMIAEDEFEYKNKSTSKPVPQPDFMSQIENKPKQNGMGVQSVLKRTKRDRDWMLSKEKREQNEIDFLNKVGRATQIPDRPTFSPDLSKSQGLTAGEKGRASSQTAKFNERMRKSEIARGIIPGSRGDSNVTKGFFGERTVLPLKPLFGETYVDYEMRGKKFGQFDALRTKAPKGVAIQRAKSVLQEGEKIAGLGQGAIEDRRFEYQKTLNAELRGGESLAEARTKTKALFGGEYKPLSGPPITQNKSDIFNNRAAFEQNSPRAQAARQAKANRLQQINDAKQERANYFINKKNGGQGFFNVGPEKSQQKNQVKPEMVQGQIVPKVLEDFNKTVDKLNGMKMELVISGSLTVNITDGALTDKVKDYLTKFVREYTDTKIIEATNKLIGDAGLPVLPRVVGQK